MWLLVSRLCPAKKKSKNSPLLIFCEIHQIFPINAQMLLTQSSKQTELEAIMPHRDFMRGNPERVLTRRPWPLLSWWGIRASLGPQSQAPLALSHSYQPLRCWDPERERKSGYWSKAAEKDSEWERRASFVPNSFLWDEISVLYLSL